MPDVDAVELEKFLKEEVSETTSETAAAFADYLKSKAYHKLVVAALALFFAILALFVNRFGFSILGFLSIGGFIVLIIYSWTSDHYFNTLSDNILEACASLKDNENGPVLLAKVAETKITSEAIQEMIRSMKKKEHLFGALKRAYGEGDIFKKHVSIGKDGVSLYVNGKDQVPFPLDMKNVGAMYQKVHARALDDLSSSGAMLDEALEDYRANAKLCSEQSTLKFPESWHAALQLSNHLLVNIDKMFKLHRIMQIDKAYRETDHTPVYRPAMREMESLASQVQGTMLTIIVITESLMGSCKAQLHAINKLTESRRPEISQAHRLEAFGRKAQNLLSPIFDGTFIIKSADGCIQTACSSTWSDIQTIDTANYFILVALMAAIVSTLFLAQFLRIMGRGLLLIFPVLEMLRVCK